MLWIAFATIVLGGCCFLAGMALGRLMLRRGATANDLFKGKEWLAWVVATVYLGLMVLAVNIPQLQVFPLDWRVVGLRITWLIVRSLLLGACGLAIVISWKTARVQLGMILMVGFLGLFSFSAAEAYYVNPIYAQLRNNLQANGIFKQTSASSCAPAALATLLQRWGIPTATELSVARFAETSRMGTSNPQVLKAAQGFGMQGIELHPSWPQMRTINRPGLLSIWVKSGFWRLSHAIVVMAIQGDQMIVADPARGHYYNWSRQDLLKSWRGDYLPIFRPQDAVLSPSQASQYLQQLGYTGRSIAEAIRSFQRSSNLPETGQLDPTTVLMLSGPFIKQEPTLHVSEFEQATVKRMGCADSPEICPW